MTEVVSQPPIDTSAWAPLKRPLFRNRLLASLVSNTGSWMQDTAGTWLMTSMTTSPFLISLMQTAASLPVLLLGIFAGASADIMDRRKLLIFWALWMLVAAAVLAALTLAGFIGVWSLLGLTFVLSIGAAMNTPTWQAIMPELVPRSELPAAVSLGSASFNIARAVGPAAGGLAVAAFISPMRGAGMVFLFNALSFVAVLANVYYWKRKPYFTSTLPSERLFGSIRAGLRYTRHAPRLRVILIRAVFFTVCVSAMWGLLAVVAQRELRQGALGYGILNGCIGFGAVFGAILLPRMRSILKPDQIVLTASIVFVLVLLTMALVHVPAVLFLALVCGGIAWTSTTASLNIAVQVSVPPWVQARSLGIYQMVFQGGMALGAAGWGAIAEHSNTSRALIAAALTMLASLPVAMRYRLGDESDLNLAPGGLAEIARNNRRAAPNIVIQDTDPEPIRITVTFRIDPSARESFLRAAYALRTIRRRDGAIRWGILEDPYDPTCFVESFVVESWIEHLRQLERFTASDIAVREKVFSFHVGVEPPRVSRMIFAKRPEDEA